MKPFVSTILCTHNAERYIDGTLQSIIDQTYTNQEILIRDDLSNDNTFSKLCMRKKQDNRIHVYTSKHRKLGPYAGLNFLLDKAKGDYIAIQDHDDIRHDKKIELQIEFLEKNKKYNACSTNRYEYREKINRICTLGVTSQQHPHTTLVFRNKGYRYDTKLSMNNDQDFKFNKLKTIYFLDVFLAIHTMKKSSTNLSRIWSNKKIQKNSSCKLIGTVKVYIFNYIYMPLKLHIVKYFSSHYEDISHPLFSSFINYLPGDHS